MDRWYQRWCLRRQLSLEQAGLYIGVSKPLILCVLVRSLTWSLVKRCEILRGYWAQLLFLVFSETPSGLHTRIGCFCVSPGSKRGHHQDVPYKKAVGNRTPASSFPQSPCCSCDKASLGFLWTAAWRAIRERLQCLGQEATIPLGGSSHDLSLALLGLECLLISCYDQLQRIMNRWCASLDIDVVLWCLRWRHLRFAVLLKQSTRSDFHRLGLHKYLDLWSSYILSDGLASSLAQTSVVGDVLSSVVRLHESEDGKRQSRKISKTAPRLPSVDKGTPKTV